MNLKDSFLKATGLDLYAFLLKGLFALLAIGVIVGGILYYGHAKYKAGVEDTDAKWVAASEKLKEEARIIEQVADENSATRVDDYTNALAQEKEKLDEAEAQNSSSFDVLFPAG